MSFNKDKMNFMEVGKLEKVDSLEEFEFYDAEGDLDVDLSKSPIHEAAEKLTSGFGLIISALCAIVEEQGMMVRMIPVKTVASTAVGALTGSLLGGPSGLAVGLITGAVIACRTSGSPKSPKLEQRKCSIREVLRNLTLQQKKELLKELLSCLKQSSVRSLIFEILKNENIRNMALEILSGFLMKKMGISLIKQK